MTTPVRLILVVLLVMYALYTQAPTPSPAPPPPDRPSRLNLDGLFMGDDAAADAALLAALCDEIADELEWDGTQEEPYMSTGVAFDELRTRARVARMSGESLGDRQPRVADAVAEYLSESVGDSGGPVDASQRAGWVSAYRDIAGACRHAIGR